MFFFFLGIELYTGYGLDEPSEDINVENTDSASDKETKEIPNPVVGIAGYQTKIEKMRKV
jgi:hypothetical protein